MTRGEAFGCLLVAFGAALLGPQLFTPRPIGLLVCAGVIVAIFGGLLICDYHETEDEQ